MRVGNTQPSGEAVAGGPPGDNDGSNVQPDNSPPVALTQSLTTTSRPSGFTAAWITPSPRKTFGNCQTKRPLEISQADNWEEVLSSPSMYLPSGVNPATRGYGITSSNVCPTGLNSPISQMCKPSTRP